ncbi:hypothetical protein B0H10DRAFT_2031117 [Mycena sp. CBHHK59/15]|nr:hypothetical protein B0H10DRAFT_2031117 [Mycena sp. CBHHK59/15]
MIKNGNYKIVRTNDGKIDLSFLPVGAMVMGAIAVERGYKLHANGDRATAPILDFSATNYATAAAGYLKTIENLTESRWTSILTACGATAAAAEAAATEIHDTLDGEREHMYTPSSP